MPTSKRRISQLHPQVLAALQAEVDKGRPQAAIAADLDASTAYVNQALKGKFAGNAATFEARVRGVYLKAHVTCPVLGHIDTKTCVSEQGKPLVATNPQRVRLYRACQSCPNRQLKGA